MKEKEKRLIIRISALVLVIVLAIVMYFIGRQHTILVDDKTVQDPSGAEYKALQMVTVRVDRQEEMELASRDRDQYIVTGQSHKITITYTDRDWNEKSVTRKFKVPVGLDTVIISIPTLAAESEAPQSAWLTEFVPPKVEFKPQEEVRLVMDDASLDSFSM